MSTRRSARSPGENQNHAPTDGVRRLRRPRFLRPTAGYIEEDGTWVDRSPPGNRELIARGKELELRAQEEEIEAKHAARAHHLRMQKWVLLGVGILLLLTVLMLVLGLWVKAISASFASELARTMLPILLGASATIVGAFFGAGANINPNSEDGSRGFRTRQNRRRRRRSADDE
jgi:uncharacterized integral membrane protein